MTIDGPSKQLVFEGNRIQLTCHYSTFTAASEVQWKRNGILISRNATMENGARGTITHFNERQLQLTIASSNSQDAGNYTCIVIVVVLLWSTQRANATTQIEIQGLFINY